MAIDGLIDRPEVVVFSDTGSELPETYATVSAIQVLCEKNKIPFKTVASKLEGSEEGIALHEYYSQKTKPPFLPMVTNPRCTFNFKIYPVRRYMKSIIDPTGPKPWASGMIGITTDESHRQRPSDMQWIANEFPLIELGMSRQDCIDYIAKNYPELKVAKSGCWCCPYSSPKTWLRLKIDHPDLFKKAREMEEGAFAKGQHLGLGQRRPLSAYDFTHTLEDFGFVIENPEEVECSSSSSGCFL